QRLAKAAEDKKKTVAKLILEGETALAAKDFEKAANRLSQASKLAPENEAVKRNLAKAQQEVNKHRFEQLVLSGKNSLNAKDYHKAFADVTEALKLFPGDKEVLKELKRAQAGRDRLLAAEAKKREAEALKKARKDADDYLKKG